MTAQTVTGAVAVRQKQDRIVDWVRAQQDEIAMVAATHVKPSAVVRVAHGALRRNPKLMAAAIANPQSLLHALLEAARLGHEPDTDDYYLVPFGGEVQGIEGYKGIIERMFRAGGVSSVVAQVVRQRDRYAPQGENTPPLHEYDDFASADERGPMRGAYAYAIFPSGRCSQVIRMGRAEIMEHKAKSRGSDKADSPWQQWEASMWKKTVLRGLEPYVPTSTEYRDSAGPLRGMAAAMALPDGGMSRPASVQAEIIHEAEIVDDTPDVPPADAVTPVPPAGPATPAGRTAGGTPLPPLPGEEENSGPGVQDETPGSGPTPGPGHREEIREAMRHADEPDDSTYDTPGTVTKAQLTRLGATFTDLGFTSREREQRLVAASQIVGRELSSSSELSKNEAGALIDTLARCEGDREKLIAILAAGEQDG